MVMPFSLTGYQLVGWLVSWLWVFIHSKLKILNALKPFSAAGVKRFLQGSFQTVRPFVPCQKFNVNKNKKNLKQEGLLAL